MRLRKNAKLLAALQDYQDIVFAPGRAKEVLSGHRRIEVELGVGRGSFLAALAKRRRDSFFAGVETRGEVLYYAARRTREAALSNVALIMGGAAFLTDWFRPGQVGAFYINFCDPWPKARHAKRRLVSAGFLRLYKAVAAADCRLYFKTDNKTLLEFSLTELAACGLKVRQMTYDLHNSGLDNPAWTEYEHRFHLLGLPVCYCAADFW
jgi:tRNA (guanine-N7-)-methyltransferase